MKKFAEHLVAEVAKLWPGSASVIIISLACATELLAQSNSLPPRRPAAGHMLQQLRETDWILRSAALDYLARHRVSAARKPIREILADRAAEPWLRGRALVAIARIEGSAARDDVLRFAKHAEPKLRGAAAEALGHLDGKDTEQVLNNLLKDRASEVRYRALASLAKHQKAKAWPLVDPMTKTLDASVYSWGIRALALVGNEASLARLTTLAQQDATVARTLRGIQGVPNPKLIGLLLTILTSFDPDDARFATGLSVLQHFKSADMLAALKSKLETGDAGMIRTVALITTLLMPAPELGEPLRQAVSGVDDAETIKTVLVALGPAAMKPERHRDLFVKFLGHADVDIRSLAIRCLAHCRNINLYEQLRPCVADESPLVIQAALGALRRAPVANAPRGQLVAYLKSPLTSDDVDVRSMAHDLLAHAGTAADFKPAMALLGVRLQSTDDFIRSEAASALGSFAPADQIESVVRAQGYLARWMIVGTFLNDKDHAGFAQVYPPEKKIDFKAKYIAKYVWVLRGRGNKKEGEIEREIGWGKASVDQTNGKLMISALVPPPGSLSVAYAVSDFHVDEKREVLLSVDGDDAFRVWLNGKQVAEKVAEYDPSGGSVAQQRGIKIALRAGANRIVVKSANLDREWWVRLRLTDAAGRPVEVRP